MHFPITTPTSTNPMHLPAGVNDQILGYLNNQQLLICSLVSKLWNTKISISSAIWSAKASSLGCKATKSDVAKQIQTLTIRSEKNSFALLKNVKTAAEFDQVGMPIANGTSSLSKEQQDQVFGDLMGELDAKLEIKENLNTYFNSLISLYKVKRASLKEVETAAARLEEKYGGDSEWITVAKVCLDLGQKDYVIELLKTKLKTNENKSYILVPFIQEFCQKGEITEAILFFKEHYHKDRFFDGYKLQNEECLNYIRQAISESKEASAITAHELMIDSLFNYDGAGFDSQKLREIADLMESLHKTNQQLPLLELFIKHSNFIAKCNQPGNSHSQMRIYFFANEKDKARDIAGKSGDFIDMMMLMYLYQEHAPTEVQKIEELSTRVKEMALSKPRRKSFIPSPLFDD